MKKIEFYDALKSLGWTIYRPHGEHVGIIKIDDRVLKCFVSIKQYELNIYKLEAYFALSTDIFNHAVSYIEESKSRILEMRFILQFNVIRQSPFDIDEIVNEGINWAKNADLDKGLAEYRALKTDCIGIFPQYHLAALAIAGDFEKLEYYKKCFEADNRLDFVPYINLGYINRAIEFAEKLRENPNYMPTKPKPRV